ncbi:hypothetical protein V1511DRAFT_350874 [Dipodascopsis uninucleata]
MIQQAAASALKRQRTPFDESYTHPHSRSKKRLIDSFTKLSLEADRKLESNDNKHKYDGAYKHKHNFNEENQLRRNESPLRVHKSKHKEPILGYDYWDRSKSKDSVGSLTYSDTSDRMDTGGPDTIFVSTLSSSEDEDDEDENDGQKKIVFVPDIEKKLMEIPYSFLQNSSRKNSSLAFPLDYHPLPGPEQETSVVLYKPKEQVITESLTRHMNDRNYDKSNILRNIYAKEGGDWNNRDNSKNFSLPDDEESWGDDEKDNAKTDTDNMELD